MAEKASGEQSTERRGREGGRWINERPTSADFAEWFKTSMKIDPKLDVEDYIGGVVLIPAVDTKAKTVTGFHNGQPVIEERPELSFIPYAKVETRTNYFWDLLEAHREEWVGVVERITPPRLTIEPVVTKEETTIEETGERKVKAEYARPGGLTQMVHQLPEGFSVMSVPIAQGYSHFLCCTIRVAIYERAKFEENEAKAVPLREGQGTKQVPLLGSYKERVWADNSALMKAETGALGRALGFAGIFVIPGSGVATAEDMYESMAQGVTPATETAAPAEAEGPTLPEVKPVQTGAEEAQDEETKLRARAAALWKELTEDFPSAQNEFGRWARSRNLRSLGEARGAMLKGVIKKLEKLLDEAKVAQQERQEGADHVETSTEETPDGGAEEATGDGDEPSGTSSSGEG